jgi:hypothetical protein
LFRIHAQSDSNIASYRTRNSFFARGPTQAIGRHFFDASDTSKTAVKHWNPLREVMRIGVNRIDLILHQINPEAKRAPKNSEIFVATIVSPSLEHLFVINVVLLNELAAGVHGSVA